MAFLSSDLYLSSGTSQIFNSWVAPVTKFDSSTFYNWEQDNEPIYDLEDRTNLLWDRVGSPIDNGFSGIPGRVFVVSADAPFAGESSGIVFKSLSSVINVLPNPITYPIIVEVANFGNLGELNLNNIQVLDSCETAGLEIVNRGFARTQFTGAGASAVYNSGDVSSVDLRNTLINSSAIFVSATVLSSTADSRLSTNYAWVNTVPYGSSPALSKRPILSRNAAGLVGTAGYVQLDEYDSTDDATIATDDISVTNLVTAASIGRASIANSDDVHSLVYTNYLTSLKIENCNGPIYIRNFCIDGTQSIDNGVEINNSTVVLENTTSIRSLKNGFKISNSNVDVRRGIVAARNYYISGGVRDTTKTGIGLLAENSLINFNPIGTSGTTSAVSGVNFIQQFAFNDIGIKLINSVINGGSKTINGTLSIGTGPSVLQTMHNNDVGLECVNSTIHYEGMIESYSNGKGLLLDNSVANLEQFSIEYNQGAGLECNNSKIVFAPSLRRHISGSVYRNTGHAYKAAFEQFDFYLNGQHIVANNSILDYPSATALDTKIGKLFAVYSFGIVDRSDASGMLPSIDFKNSTKATLIHPVVITLQSDFLNSITCLGAAISVTNNSEAKIKASKNGETLLIGPSTAQAQKIMSAVYAGKNSSVEFNGNTLIAQAGVNILAEDESIVNLNPHRKENKTLDAAGWSLTDVDNHTRIELHSTRACLVVDNSILNIEDLGNYENNWNNNTLTSSSDYFESPASACIYKGYLQFYPNPQDTTVLTANANTVTPVALNSYAYDSTPGHFLVDFTQANSSQSDAIKAISLGGLCVKAQNNSTVNVLNTNFPAGWYGTSGNYYDASGGNEMHLRIWNICQDSKLEAAFCSVSSMYPCSAGYYGPSGVYVSAVGQAAYAAPSSTPDTSTLSVLDYYGPFSVLDGCLICVQGATNCGVFRLYFSPNSEAKMLGYISGTVPTHNIIYGPPYQMLAQGYNPSGNLIGANAHAFYYADVSAAKFYYVSSMLDPSYRNRIRLDESAADTFANAKHNAIAKSGRSTLVTIYRSTTDSGGQGQAYASGDGLGFKSAELFDIRRDI